MLKMLNKRDSQEKILNIRGCVVALSSDTQVIFSECW